MALTQKGLELAQAFYGLDVRYRVVATGDSVDLGNGKKLTFVESPNVHWPDTMITLEESTGTLMQCDAWARAGLAASPEDLQLIAERAAELARQVKEKALVA